MKNYLLVDFSAKQMLAACHCLCMRCYRWRVANSVVLFRRKGLSEKTPSCFGGALGVCSVSKPGCAMCTACGFRRALGYQTLMCYSHHISAQRAPLYSCACLAFGMHSDTKPGCASCTAFWRFSRQQIWVVSCIIFVRCSCADCA